MKRKIAMEWAKALESGQFEQGRYNLHRREVGQPDTFCCLGVLCTIATGRIELPVTESRTTTYVDTPHTVGYGRLPHHGTLPEEVVKWAEMASDTGTTQRSLFSKLFLTPVEGEAMFTRLSYMNDNDKTTFPEIAAHIRKNWRRL